MTSGLDSKRVSRRRLLAATGAVGLTAGALVACSNDEGAPKQGAATASPPKKGGVLRTGQFGDPTLNFGAPIGLGVQNAFVIHAVLEPLVPYRNTIEPELVLVDQLEYSRDTTRLLVQLTHDL